MKSMLFVVVLLSLLCLFLSAAVLAQGIDPTKKGRYIVVGGEVSYPGAQVVSQLPPGASPCNPIGEAVDAEVWNSTRAGRANKIKLTDKAQTSSTPDGKTFLCYCIAGFNEIFFEQQTETRQEETQKSANLSNKAVASASATYNGPKKCPTSNVTGPGGGFYVQEQCEGEDAVLIKCLYGCESPPPVQQAPVAVKKGHSTRKAVIAFFAGLGAGYGLSKIGGKGGPPGRITRIPN